MDRFTASNGITVFVRDGGTVQFKHGTREESCGTLQVFPQSEWGQTLREFFRAEEDERRGRWRWPENPDYVVYLDDGDAMVMSEADPRRSPDRIPRRYLDDPKGSLGWGEFAARAYFDAHPELKPWHTARAGEVWALTVHGVEAAFLRIDGDRGAWAVYDPAAWSPLLALNAYGITDGRRIWPEASSDD